jgi:glyoxylase-like metal-dependent hydrolase (beta-lactamase superfamily II)
MKKLTVKNDIFKLTLPTPFPVGDVNVYVVKGEKLTLIDAGAKTKEAWDIFKEQLSQIGYKPSDIEQIILTHHHPDHVGLLDYLPENIPVIGHWRNQPWISRDESFFKTHEQFFKEMFVQCGIDRQFFKVLSKFKIMEYSCQRSLTHAVAEGDRIEGLQEWTVIETPGHAQSHIVLYREKDGLMIGGDHLLATISSNPLLEPPTNGETERPKPQIQYNQSLQKLLNFDINCVMAGHGPDVTNAHDLIKNRLAKQKERAYSVLSILREKPMTAFEVCQRLFPTLFHKELMLTMSETIGQLDYLEEAGEVKKDTTGEYFLYYVR